MCLNIIAAQQSVLHLTIISLGNKLLIASIQVSSITYVISLDEGCGIPTNRSHVLMDVWMTMHK